MIKADRIYLGKILVDYSDAIQDTRHDMNQSTEMMKAIIEGIGARDNRPQEINQYEDTLKKLAHYCVTKGISIEELIEFGEEYKNVLFQEYFELKGQVTIKEEVDKYLGINA